jgi:hypothetical protein
MQTTIRLEDGLFRKAKAHASAAGRSLNEFISDAVRAALVVRPVADAPGIPTFRGKGLQPGIDLDDSAALLEAMSDPYEYAEKRPARKVAAERPKKAR